MSEPDNEARPNRDSQKDGWKELLRWMLVASTLLFAGFSFFATRQGLLMYFSAPMATGLALGIALALFGLAWLVGMGGSRRIAVYYGIVMAFSVAFSYVYLQSEFVTPIRSNAQQRLLADTLRITTRRLIAEAQSALGIATMVELRVDSCKRLETNTGFSTRACIREPLERLNEICARLRERVAAWEASTGRPYREGPGEELIFESLVAEGAVVEQDTSTMRRFIVAAAAAEYTADTMPNATRLQLYEPVANEYPRDVVQRYVGRRLNEPPTFDLERFDEVRSRYDAQWQSLIDLTRLFRLEARDARLNLASGASLIIALFIDGFVLLIALGGRDRALKTLSSNGRFPARRLIPKSWDSDVGAEVSNWTRSALVNGDPRVEEAETLVEDFLKAVETPDGREDQVVVSDKRLRRFAEAMCRAGAAELAGVAVVEGTKCFAFRLRRFVQPALVRYLYLLLKRPPSNPSADEFETSGARN